MTSQPDLPHKVSQIRHDLDDLYELVSEVQQQQTRISGVLHRHGNRLEELQQTLDLHSGRLDRIEDNQRRMQENLGLVQGNLGRVEDNQSRQFEHLSTQMAEILDMLRGPKTTDPAP